MLSAFWITDILKIVKIVCKLTVKYIKCKHRLKPSQNMSCSLFFVATNGWFGHARLRVRSHECALLMHRPYETCTVLHKLQHFVFFFVFSCIFILLSQENDQCTIRARLGVASHLSTTSRWENPAKCLSQRHK